MEAIGLRMLWDVYGTSLEALPADRVSLLSEVEIEAFRTLRQYSVAKSLALRFQTAMPSFDSLTSEDSLLATIEQAARACQAIEDLREIEALRR